MRPATELSDDELRAELKSLGFEPGPITAAARSIFEKKLDSLRNKGNDKSAAASASPPAKEPSSNVPTNSTTAAVEHPRPMRPMKHNPNMALKTVSQKSSTEQHTAQVTSTSNHAASTQVVETVTTTNNASSTNISSGANSVGRSGDASVTHVIVRPRPVPNEKKIFQELNDRLANYIEIVRNLEMDKGRLEMKVRELTIKVRQKGSIDSDAYAAAEYERDSLRKENTMLREQLKDSDYRLRVTSDSCANKDKTLTELRAEAERLRGELNGLTGAKLKVDEELRTYNALLGSEESRLKLRTSANSSEELFYDSISSGHVLSSTFNENAISPSAEGYRPKVLNFNEDDDHPRPKRSRHI